MTGEVGKFPTSRVSDPAHQFKHRNLRPCAQADGEADRADAAVDVELAAGLFVPSSAVGKRHTAGVEAAV